MCDLIMVCDDVSVHGKLSLPFRGPWEIIEVTPTNAVISMRMGTKTVIEKVHIDKLTKFHPALGPRTFTGTIALEFKPLRSRYPALRRQPGQLVLLGGGRGEGGVSSRG